MAIWRAMIKISHPALGGTGTNTFHIREDSVPPFNTGQQDEIMGWVQDFYTASAGVFSSGAQIVWDGALAGVGPDEGKASEITPWTVSGVGSAGTLPPFVCLCVNWTGSQGDRSKRGRTFMGPCAPGTNGNDGKPQAGILGTLRTAAAALVESSDSFDNGAVGIWSRQESLFRDVVASGVRNQYASLRSRRD